MKINIMKITTSIFCIMLTINLAAQQKYYSSSSNLVSKANGVSANVKNEKKIFFSIWVDSSPSVNDKGSINLQDVSFSSDYKNRMYFEHFRIYSIDFKSTGIYNYWTIDVGFNGQIVLFQVDQNSATPTITLHRYAPGEGSNVLKTIVYYLD